MPAPELEEDSVDLTPMIDVVFLLLIFFMVTMRIVQEETELIVPLPSKTESSEPPEIPPQNVRIEIDAFGQVTVDGLPSDSPNERNMTQLTSTLLQKGQFGAKSDVKIIINIKPDGQARHKYTIHVLNALTKANEELKKLGVPPEKLLKNILFE
jgi:biopolymer transport protein ExbD